MSQSSYGRSAGLLSLLTVVVAGGLLLGGGIASAQTMDQASSTALVQAGMPLTIQTNYLPSFTLGVPYMGGFSAMGGTGVYRWSLVGGNLPSGLSLDTNGRLYGQPESMGASMFTVRVTDNGNNVVQQTYQVMVGLAGADVSVSSTIPVANPANSTSSPLQVITEPVSTGTTSLPPLTSPLIIPNWNTPRVLLLQNLQDLEIAEGSLIRVARDPSGVNDGPHADVYYIGRDGKRHAFASEKVYRSSQSPCLLMISTSVLVCVLTYVLTFATTITIFRRISVTESHIIRTI